MRIAIIDDEKYSRIELTHQIKQILPHADIAEASSGVQAVILLEKQLFDILFIDIHLGDMADACVYLLENYDGELHVNIGTGEEVSIKELSELVAKTVGFSGGIRWNTDMPDGTPKKLTDVTRLHGLGWHHRISLEEGLKATYRWYLENEEHRGE